MSNEVADRRLALATAALFLVLAAWDLSGLDLALAHAMAGPSGFALRGHWLLTAVLHEGGRRAAWLLALLLCTGVWWPRSMPPPLRGLARLDSTQRLAWATGMLVSVFAISALKAASPVSCPWDLTEFGGTARHLSHWEWFAGSDGGSGGCFPAGHASSGFAFIGGFFAWRRTDPALARRWLAGSMAAGLMLGIGQQLRGAHFMSHTAWTGFACWCIAWAAERVRTACVARSPVAEASAS